MKVRVVAAQGKEYQKQLAEFRKLRETIFGGELHWAPDYLDGWNIPRSRAESGLTAVMVAISRGRVVGGVRVDRCVHPFPQEPVVLEHLPSGNLGLHKIPHGILSSLCVTKSLRGVEAEEASGEVARCSVFLMSTALRWMFDQGCVRYLAITNTSLLPWFKDWGLRPVGKEFDWVGPAPRYHLIQGSVRRALATRNRTTSS